MAADGKSKVLEYEQFLNERLREDLRLILEQRDKLYEEISEYLQLKSTIEKIKEDINPESVLKTKVDLGCNFYVQANVPDPTSICVAIGYGFFLEMTLDEAVVFIKKKTDVLQEKIDILTADAGKVKAHIRLVLEGLRELQQIQAETDPGFRDVLS
ncbi:uxt-like protein [Plakobranchus ocellatus]|uniref:Uxt-like protein n=1 Tax=Plakobranchus ocellatus TaxID=259542 RepID=A0AAV4B9W7_9GAST|nr:uxt-like protein [Plakobranchus ocellatus]